MNQEGNNPANTAALDAEVRAAIYAGFVKTSRAPDVSQLADLLGRSTTEIGASLGRLAEGHILVLDQASQIHMAMPFSAVPTAFRVNDGDRAWYANCAWDALGIPAALGADARIETSCADCGETLNVEIRDGLPAGDKGVIHFAVPAAHWWDDIAFT